MIGLIGPIDLEMLLRGQETHKYFTKEYDLYYITEVGVLILLYPVRYVALSCLSVASGINRRSLH